MNREYFFYRTNDGLKKQRLEDVVFLQSAGNYVKFYLPTSDFLVRKSFESVLKLLPEDMFVQIDRRFAVAIAYIELIGKDSIILDDGRERFEVPFSKKYLPGMRRRIIILDSSRKKLSPTK